MWVVDVVEAEEGMWCPVLFDFGSAAGGVLLLLSPLPPDACPAEGGRMSIRNGSECKGGDWRSEEGGNNRRSVGERRGSD